MHALQGAVGDHIQTLGKGDIEQKLWSFVSSFSENNMDGDKLSRLYVKLKGNKANPSGQNGITHSVCDHLMYSPVCINVT